MHAKNEPRLSAQAHRTLICLMRAGSASFARISSDTKKRVSIYIHTISTLIEVVDDGRRGSALLQTSSTRQDRILGNEPGISAIPRLCTFLHSYKYTMPSGWSDFVIFLPPGTND